MYLWTYDLPCIYFLCNTTLYNYRIIDGSTPLEFYLPYTKEEKETNERCDRYSDIEGR